MNNFKNYKLSFWAVCAVVMILGLPACFGLFTSHVIEGHDAMSNLMMGLYTDKYAGGGQFLVRWASGINYGYGYPMFNFYPPAFFYFTLFISKIFHNVVLSMNLLA